MLLLLHTRSSVVSTPVSTDVPTNTVTVPWSRRPYLAVDKTGWRPLGQVLAENGVDARLVYKVADINGIADPRSVPVGATIWIPQ